MARIPFNELGDCKILRRYDSKAADELANLASADHDLSRAAAALDYIRSLPDAASGTTPVAGFDVVVAALMDSVAIRYRRAVEDGAGRKGNSWFEAQLEDGLQQAHKKLIRLADEHVAHAGRHHELSFALVGLSNLDPATVSVVLVNGAVRSLYRETPNQLAEYSRLVAAAKRAINAAMTSARKAVEMELRALSGAELLALPVAGTDGEDPPRRARHGA